METLLEAACVPGIPTFPPRGIYRMYAIAFDLDTEELQRSYPSPSWQNAYRDIRDVLYLQGFTWQQGSVQFGGADVTPVTCVLAVQDLVRRFAWFARSVRDIRMLRIEENNDLLPAIERTV
jgi:virulence-associated protein VapD